jgi:spore germination protein KA
MWKKTNGTNTEPVEKPEDNINTSTPSDQDPYGIMKPLSPVLTENINRLKDIFKYDKSVIYRCFGNRHTESFHACIVFVSNMADHKDINENLIAPILQSDLRDVPKDEMIDYLKTKVIPSMDMKETEYMDSVLQSLFEGDTVLFVDGEDKALVIRSTDYAERQITEPEFEKVLEGPREGFVENLSVNLTLIRRRLKSPELKFKFKEVGTRTRTTICLCYLENLVNERVLNELNMGEDLYNAYIEDYAEVSGSINAAISDFANRSWRGEISDMSSEWVQYINQLYSAGLEDIIKKYYNNEDFKPYIRPTFTYN